MARRVRVSRTLRQRAVSIAFRRVWALLIPAALLLAAPPQANAQQPVSVGLFTSLPILWSEEGDISALLKSEAPPHWARAVLEKHGKFRPLDHLGAGKAGLDGIKLLVMAQPRALSPQENVALDKWGRSGGGRLLLFADPMLTSESAFPLGDKRRPQAIVMLGPVLAHWGLRLDFDAEQAPGAHDAKALGLTLPVNLPGSLVALHRKRGCQPDRGGLTAQCRIGKGRVVVIADAALLEEAAAEDADSRARLLELLLKKTLNL